MSSKNAAEKKAPATAATPATPVTPVSSALPAAPLADFESSHVIFDLAAIRFRPKGSYMTAYSPTGELLGTGKAAEGQSTREACLSALDDAAARTQLWRYGRKIRVGFYNPFTAEISLGPSFNSTVYALSAPLGFPKGGLLVRLGSEDELVAVTGEVAVLRPTPSLSELSRLFLSSRDSATPRPRF